MKRVLTAVLLCLLVLLCGCTRQPEAEPPAQEAVSVSPVPVQENDPASVEQKTEAQDPVPIPDGIVKINGLAIYYQNGQPLAGTGLTELDGQLLYVQPDGSLFFFSRGVNRCGDTLYYQTGEDGYALLPPPAGLYDDGQALYDVQPDGSLLTGSADGHLTFGADGRYTSGSEELDTGIAQLLSDSNPDALDARETRLSLAFDYIRDHFKYLSSKPDNDHAWTMIEENGETRLYDVQLEYAYLYQFGKGEIDAYAMTDSGGSVYNGFQYYFP